MVSHSHRPTPHPSRKWFWAALAIVLVGGAAAIALAMKKSPRSAAAGCPHPTRQLQVAAAPDIAPAVAAVARTVEFSDCNPTRIRVRAVDPAAQAATPTGARNPQVWIPDSTTELAQVPGTIVAARSLAKSPVVLAVGTSAARALGAHPTFDEIAAAATTAHPFVLAVADPARSAPTLGTLVGLHRDLAANPSSGGNLVAMLQNTTTLTTPVLPARPDVINGAPVAVPTTEQAVRTANRTSPVYSAVYPSGSAPVLDYPYVVMGKRVDRDAATLLSALTSAKGRAVLAAYGFRAASTAGSAPSSVEVRSVLQSVATLRKPSRLLAVIDVSGSMNNPVPGLAGSTRIEVARTAAAEGLGLLPPDSAVGLWRFSANLTPTTDYQQLVPVAPLSDATRGELAGAVGQLRAVPNGGTGLYDSVLGAVRSMRTHFDPTRINSVVVLTDGKDEADAKHGITLPALVTALKAQAASSQPVKVIAIGYGPDTDTGALRAITAASGGILYTSADPRDLPGIFRNAIGHRVCVSHC